MSLSALAIAGKYDKPQLILAYKITAKEL